MLIKFSLNKTHWLKSTSCLTLFGELTQCEHPGKKKAPSQSKRAKFVKDASPEASGSVILTCHLWDGPSSLLKSGFFCPHGCPLGFYKRLSRLTALIQTMWATCQSDGTRTGLLFPLSSTGSHVDKLLRKSQRSVCLFKVQRTLKERHKQI